MHYKVTNYIEDMNLQAFVYDYTHTLHILIRMHILAHMKPEITFLLLSVNRNMFQQYTKQNFSLL